MDILLIQGNKQFVICSLLVCKQRKMFFGNKTNIITII